MIDYNPLYTVLKKQQHDDWADELKKIIPRRINQNIHGDLTRWIKIINSLPHIPDGKVDFTQKDVRVNSTKPIEQAVKQELRQKLMELHPWRKGPFDIFGIKIDAEWRSDKKWRRLEEKISPLKDRAILDIGCGNGYYGWRMLGAGAKLVIGVEPFLKNVFQYMALNKYLEPNPFYVLPLGIDDLPQNLEMFDTVFSMGVFYHRRSPFDHLFQLKSFLKSDGELVLETLVVDGQDGEVLVPEGRYAKMRNVWFLPSVPTLQAWLKRAGFRNISCIDISVTTTDEQRQTEWMTFESLPDFLDPQNQNLTIEGLPAPRRVIFTAIKP